jgi:hypothetical protein
MYKVTYTFLCKDTETKFRKVANSSQEKNCKKVTSLQGCVPPIEMNISSACLKNISKTVGAQLLAGVPCFLSEYCSDG